MHRAFYPGLFTAIAFAAFAGAQDPATHDNAALHALLLSENAADRLQGLQSAGPHLLKDATCMEQVITLVDDTDPAVRLEAVRQLGFVWLDRRPAPLARACRRDGAQPEFQAAILAAAKEVAKPLLHELLQHQDLYGPPEHAILLKTLSQYCGASEGANLSYIKGAFAALPDHASEQRKLLATGFLAGAVDAGRWEFIRRLADSRSLPEGLLAQLIEEARTSASSNSASVDDRVHAIGLLSLDSFEQSGQRLAGLVSQKEPLRIQSVALRALSKMGDPRMVALIFERWPSMGPAIRQQFMFDDIRRQQYLLAMLDAIEAGRIDAETLRPWGLQEMQQHADILIRSRMDRVLPPRDPEIAASINTSFQTLSQLAPAIENGKKLYQENCALCHRFDGGGFQVGPDLDVKAQSGAFTIVKKLLYPNTDALTFLYSYKVETSDFEQFAGVIVAEEDDAIVVRIPGGQDTRIPRENIDLVECTEKTLMPEGWTATLGEQGMADVVEYLVQTIQNTKK
ncbi:MAG: c-type cytochrome [Candidatus Hydrogenedentes bacterium]|nr:c-type cytochrome [Candidatus Hydrogenedentota bacterium]